MKFSHTLHSIKLRNWQSASSSHSPAHVPSGAQYPVGQSSSEQHSGSAHWWSSHALHGFAEQLSSVLQPGLQTPSEVSHHWSAEQFSSEMHSGVQPLSVQVCQDSHS